MMPVAFIPDNLTRPGNLTRANVLNPSYGGHLPSTAPTAAASESPRATDPATARESTLTSPPVRNRSPIEIDPFAIIII
jgi:hypothetical protein